jgi:hypothetical protein
MPTQSLFRTGLPADIRACYGFIHDLAERMARRFELTTDAFLLGNEGYCRRTKGVGSKEFADGGNPKGK